MLSKQDKLLMVLPRLVKKVIGNDVISRRGKRKIHTLEIGGHVQMAKSVSRHKGSPRYRIAHGWKMRMDLLNLNP
jgi:hypothetical protein